MLNFKVFQDGLADPFIDELPVLPKFSFDLFDFGFDWLDKFIIFLARSIDHNFVVHFVFGDWLGDQQLSIFFISLLLILN